MRSGGIIVATATALMASAVLPMFLSEAWQPDVFALVMVFAALRAPRREALSYAWVIGLIRDAVSGGPLGAYALAYLVASACILRMRAETENRLLITYAPHAFAVALATGGLHASSVSMRVGAVAAWQGFRVVVVVAMISAVAMVPTAWILGRLSRWLGWRGRYRFGMG